ncbi:hypothetical protein KNV07_gp092 [Vibrio phage Cody]|uniref:Uncharacterized protein n=4 Tax=Thalassavirus TaxID=2948922 RepID=A0A6M4ES64_9CAUD|nr:hypothetical protein KNU87_gp091 [Vibrio phage Bennett]YP_010105879.1 hypothetical protein KNU88_gp093 [Vibrio phage Chester]YP_010108136.1 hypothetical protein KNV06_gp091 [Vibrio phage AG74]YP_010108328.1 hypothetical protein KNV07_gp092 [Vibrio phage Cody]QIG66215.1 hypothetical protein CILSICK_94 [Vibrio phage Cilsick]QKE60952.1 hypothetical protein DAX_91 [Vibrio phage Dax]QKN84560.1 hypothetical protein BBMUFFIN_94 [Vibrio phage BBMuffin]QQO89926.1 hypothetical protein ABURR_91 [Vib
MNGKMAKNLRRIAHGLTVVDSNELVDVHGTKRVRTAPNGTKVATRTQAHAKGSYRNVLKQVKSGRVHPFDPSENAHVA